MIYLGRAMPHVASRLIRLLARVNLVYRVVFNFEKGQAVSIALILAVLLYVKH